MSKRPTRSPTHEDVPLARLAAMGLELEELAGDEPGAEPGATIELAALVELAEDRGRPASHYLAAIPLATELALAAPAPLVVRVCAGTCQRYGALDLLDHLAARATAGAPISIAPVACLDRCDAAPACEVRGDGAPLAIAPASIAAVDEAIAALG